MISFLRPSVPQIQTYLSTQHRQPFSYDFPGETCSTPTPRRGWNIDHARVLLGHGESCFDCARRAIDAWRMFPSELTTVHCSAASTPPPRAAQTVAILYRAALLHLWLLFPARVVYLLDETTRENETAIHRYGFAYGTLPDHPERGEERFLVEWNESDNTVHYDLLAISQSHHWLARIGYLYTRREQARVRRLSCAAMQSACQSQCRSRS